MIRTEHLVDLAIRTRSLTNAKGPQRYGVNPKFQQASFTCTYIPAGRLGCLCRPAVSLSPHLSLHHFSLSGLPLYKSCVTSKNGSQRTCKHCFLVAMLTTKIAWLHRDVTNVRGDWHCRSLEVGCARSHSQQDGGRCRRFETQPRKKTLSYLYRLQVVEEDAVQPK